MRCEDGKYERLVSALLNGALTSAEKAELNRALASSARCRRIYCEQMHIHALLAGSARMRRRRAGSGWRRMRRWAAAAAAAALAGLAAAGVAYFGRAEKAEPVRAVARVPAVRAIAAKPAEFAEATVAPALEERNAEVNAVTNCLAAATLAASAASAQGLSNAIRIDADPGASIHWRTLLAESAEINWSWPDGAQSAVLRISGAGGVVSETFERPASSWTWQAAAPRKESEENVYSLTLSFFTGEGGTGGELADEALAAEGIGGVRGVNGASARVFGEGPEDFRWTRVYGSRAVLPICAGSTNLAVNGAAQELPPAPGWFMVSPLAAEQEYELLLEGAESGSATFVGYPGNFIIIIH